ncbi:MAG TPA: NUDIX hydrolase [Bacteroidales bacterium]|nr:NUDIX hydrolase [Bacteroidales bacterium]
MSYTYPYPRPAVTADALIYRKDHDKLEILLIQRAFPPFKDCWALPGGFLDMEETLEECIAREVQEETGLSGLEFVQLEAFSALNRDPRHRTITVVFLAQANCDGIPQAGSDASHVQWFAVGNLPALAFDHESVIEKALTKLALLS